MNFLDLIKKIDYLKASPLRSSLISPCCTYAISKGEGGKYRKKTSFKWGLTSRSVDFYIIIVLYLYQIFVPSHWMLLIITPKNLYHPSMECCRPLQLHVYLFPQSSPKFTKKYFVLV